MIEEPIIQLMLTIGFICTGVAAFLYKNLRSEGIRRSDILDKKIDANSQEVKDAKQETEKKIDKLEKNIDALQKFDAAVRLISRCRAIHTEVNTKFIDIDNKTAKAIEALRNEIKPLQESVVKFLAAEEEKKSFHSGEDGYQARLIRLEEKQYEILEILKKNNG